MQKATRKKLMLNRETVRSLGGQQSGYQVGGDAGFCSSRKVRCFDTPCACATG